MTKLESLIHIQTSLTTTTFLKCVISAAGSKYMNNITIPLWWSVKLHNNVNEYCEMNQTDFSIGLHQGCVTLLWACFCKHFKISWDDVFILAYHTKVYSEYRQQRKGKIKANRKQYRHNFVL